MYLETNQSDLTEKPTQNRLHELTNRTTIRHLVSAGLIISDLIAIIAAFALAGIIRSFVSQILPGELEVEQVITILTVSIPIYFMFSFNNNAHSARALDSISKSTSRALIAFALTSVSLLLIAFFLQLGTEFSRLLFGIGVVLCFISLAASRVLMASLVSSLVPDGLYANLCIYDGIPISDTTRRGSIDAKVAGLHPDIDDVVAVKKLGQFAKNMDRIVVHCPAELRPEWASALKILDVPTEIVVPEFDVLTPLAISRRSGHTSLLMSSGQLRWNQKVVKRIFDILVSSTSILLLSPILIGIAIAIKLDSEGPVIFKQERIGLGNRHFMIWKFRSMRTDVQDVAGSKLTERDDPRISRIGAFIRRTSIDELPQLFNVLRGDMSIVGPRPHPEMAKAGELLYWEVDKSYWQRHVVKPGITGLAQVSGHRGNTFQENDLRARLGADLQYVANWSLWNDVKIFFLTFRVLRHNNAF